ncbi:hypothetical protein [Mucilaginibacter mallensis]|nr:hypothetical protein [Mucilaginibacter mallensis]
MSAANFRVAVPGEAGGGLLPALSRAQSAAGRNQGIGCTEYMR